MSATSPPIGAMYLYDYAQAPLPPGEYRLDASTTIEKSGVDTESLANQRYFNVTGPRFVLNPGDIASVLPPRNGAGPFSAVLPQIVLRRRTLPWERALGAGLSQPWLALLLLVEGEDYELKTNLPLESVLPHADFVAIGSPANVLVDALDIDHTLLQSLLPSREELPLLAHVREVNPDDRELSVEGSEGWFSVVVSNRLPTPGKKCRAVLVSLEGRASLVAVNPPPVAGGFGGGLLDLNAVEVLDVRLDAPPPATTPAPEFAKQRLRLDRGLLVDAPLQRAKLVALTSWTFTCEGEGDFMMLMQRLDTGLIGKVTGENPALTDTGHLRVEVSTRAGTRETALYRGPLVPMPLTRDPNGPYHSADQARRIAPEAGVQDISYAAAFEIGRLLAAADGRLGQELMRWRRRGFIGAARLDVLSAIEQLLDVKLADDIADKLMRRVLPLASAKLVDTLTRVGPPTGDPFGLAALRDVPGLQPALVAKAFALDSGELGREVLIGLGDVLAQPAPKLPAIETIPAGSLEKLLADREALDGLELKRGAVIENVRTRVAISNAAIVKPRPRARGRRKR
jgi:hypothetical protein